MRTQKLKQVLAGFLAGAMVITSVAYGGPVTAYAANKTVTVSTQQELNSALKNLKQSKKTIVIKTSKAKTFTIKKGTYAKATLKVNAAKSRIVNNAKFAAVQIVDAKSVTEKANGNTITDKDKKLKIVVAKSAKKTNIVANKKAGTLNLVANGDVKSLKVKTAQKVVLSGNATTIPTISVTKEGADITSSIPVDLRLGANATITLNKGAEKSSVALQKKDVVATLQNNTENQIVIKSVDGKETVIDAGKSSTDASSDDSKNNDSNKDNSNNDSNTSGGGSSGGTATPSEPEVKGEVVKTLDELKKKLEESKLSQTAVTITYQSDAKEAIEIAEGDYSNVTLIVDAPNATITNKAKFAKVELKRIAANTWIEKTTGNLIDIVAPNVHIQIPENCSAKISISKLQSAAAASNVLIENDGQIESLTVASKADIKIDGKSTESIIPVKNDAEGVSITTTCPVQVTASKSIALDLQENASSSSSVKVANDSVKADIRGVGQVTITNEETGHQSTVMAEPSNNTPSDPEAVSKTKLTGNVVDAAGEKLSATVYAFKYQASQTNSSLEDVIAGMKETDHPSDVYVTVTKDDGSYELTVPYGNYSLVIKATDKASYFRTVVAVGEKVALGETVLQDLKVGKGSIEGTVTDAATGATVPAGITIRLYAGQDTVWGKPVAETKTDENGHYAFAAVDPGYYSLQFVDLRETEDSLYVIASNGGLVTENATLTINQIISKRVSDGQIRFVLHWAAEDEENDTVASDLDSHLVGPAAQPGERFHVYFADRTCAYGDEDSDEYKKYVDLDVDDTAYLGPETITIYQSVNGLYHYYVHNYTDNSAYSYYKHQNRLATSKPYVEVIRGDVRIAEFNLAADAIGNVWDVCTYDPATNTIKTVDKTYFNDGDYENLGADAAYYQKKTGSDKRDYVNYYGVDAWGADEITKAAQKVIDMDETAIASADADAIREVYDALHWKIVEYEQSIEQLDFSIDGVYYAYNENGDFRGVSYDTDWEWNEDDVKEYYISLFVDEDATLPDIHKLRFDVNEKATTEIQTIDGVDYVVVKIDNFQRAYKVNIVKRVANYPLGVSVNGTALSDDAWTWHFDDAEDNESNRNEIIIYGTESQLSGTLSFTVADGADASYITAAEDEEEVPEGYIGILSIDAPNRGTVNFFVKYVQRAESSENTEE